MIVSHLRAYQSPIGWLFYVVPLLIISTWSLHKNVSFSMGTPCYIKLHISMYQLIDDEAHIIFKAMTYVRVLISCRLSDTNNTTWTILKYEEAVHKYKYMYFLFIIPIEKSLKIPIGQIEFVNRRPNDTMTTTKDQTIQWLQQKDKRYNDYNKRTKTETMLYKILHRTQTIELNEHHLQIGVLQMGRHDKSCMT
jgi:hypothetical protein